MIVSRRQLLFQGGSFGVGALIPGSIGDNNFLLQKSNPEKIYTITWNTQWLRNVGIDQELTLLFENILRGDIDILCLQECPKKVLRILPENLSYFQDGVNIIILSDALSPIETDSFKITGGRKIQLWKVEFQDEIIHIINGDFSSLSESGGAQERQSQMQDLMEHTQKINRVILALDRNTFWDKEVTEHENIAHKNGFLYTPPYRTHQLSLLEGNSLPRRMGRLVGSIFGTKSSLDVIYAKGLSLGHSGPLRGFQGSDHTPVGASVGL